MVSPPRQLSDSNWLVDEPDPVVVEQLRSDLDLPLPMARALVNRGIQTPEDGGVFLEPALGRLHDPLQMRDMDRAVQRTMDAMAKGETICIHGDYDADGMTSTALLAAFFEQASYPVRTFLPDRLRDGYGLNPDRLKALVSEGVNLFITVDCGVRALEEAELLRSLGADLVVLDHHTPGDSLPAAAAVVDPHRSDCEFPFKDLAAVGVAFYFVGALRRSLSEAGRMDREALDVRGLLDLVAVGTITDAVPLKGDNRVLVSAGLQRLTTDPRLGLAALKAVAGMGNRPVTPGVVAFQLGPRLNAVGRLGNPGVGLDLLLASDPEEASRFADALDRENQARRDVEAEVVAQAFHRVDAEGGPAHKAVVVAGENWHPGVVGIVASKLVERYQRPAIVISIGTDEARGSCRSVKGFDIGAALSRLSHILIRCGGHPMAAGLSVDPDRIDEFTSAFCDLADLEISDEELLPTLHLDAAMSLTDLDVALVNRLGEMQPHGIGNPEPLYGVFNAEVVETRRVGREKQHLQMSFSQEGVTVPAIWWNGGEVRGLEPGTAVDVAFNAMLDNRSGHPRLKVRHLRLASPGP